MKFKLIIPLLFPLFLSAQNTTFESVFQTVEQETKVEIYHTKIEVKVTNTNIEIYSLEEQIKKLVFTFPVSMQTSDNNVYWCADENGSTATYIKSCERLFITNSIMRWIIYGQIPNLVEVQK